MAQPNSFHSVNSRFSHVRVSAFSNVMIILSLINKVISGLKLKKYPEKIEKKNKIYTLYTNLNLRI